MLASSAALVAARGFAEPSAEGRTQPPDAGVLPADATGRPICVRVGTKSEGWAWPSGRFIHWAKCKGVVPKCQAAGAGYEVEGWYANGVLVAPEHCAKSSRTYH